MRDKLIELIIDGVRNYTKPHEVCSQLDLEAFADYLISRGVTVQEWIPVSERLPEDDKRNHFYDDGNLIFTTVLGYDKEGGVRLVNRINVKPCGIDYIDRLATEGWRWSYRAEEVTHWMPLPEAPKEVE